MICRVNNMGPLLLSQMDGVSMSVLNIPSLARSGHFAILLVHYTKETSTRNLRFHFLFDTVSKGKGLDSGSATATDYIVIYDPDGGFVTGGGWIMSPAGAYAADPMLTGKANFGFVSKYKKGASVPTGQTEFQFKARDLNFLSSSYDWLVVTGQDKAKYKGVGTINGEGNYGFMLTATDGSPDTFRIKIWDKDNGDALVYDNQMGEADDGYAGTAIGGGNIKVHDGK
jgi:hypothetical protein